MKKLLLIIALFVSSLSCDNQNDGLIAVDVYGNFTNKGFTLEKPYVGKWICTDDNINNKMIVELTGEHNKIINVVGTFLCYDKNMIPGKEFLSYLASTPYPNSSPQTAKDWIIENWGKSVKTTISNADFNLICNGTNAMLSIDLKY